MKKSYRLLGICWDRRAIPKEKPMIFFRKENTGAKEYRISQILQIDDIELQEQPENDDQKLLWIDYLPKHELRCIWEFYICRLLQIAEYYNAEIVCDNIVEIQKLTSKIEDYYKEKVDALLK